MKPSMQPNPKSEAELFDAALDFPNPRERAAYLDKTCAGRPELRQRVDALLAAHDKAAGFLEVRRAQGTPAATVRLNFPAEEKPGDVIGRYKLLQKIGEGGCGVVYMAEQETPVRRRVALKVIKLGMDTKEVVARFEAERQALALMDHPNIAKVLDAGATTAGRPYFVMELVKGIPATRYADENKLSTRQRLDLFIQICQAVQHAHQKGIIHRDIKPSNILVADHDGVPVPKVIDFGIAKATTDQRLTDKTLFTALEQFVGTPAYMSPEQAKLSGLDIDTRSDIYSLGVLLYELLTGKTPFDPTRLLNAGFEGIRRIIREEEPPKPSTRLSTLDAVEQTTVAKQRQSEPPKLLGGIRGDLDWIVMECLEKDRTRRYETANGLAADVQRHLSNEPVVACPPSAAYRFQKMVRRNKAAFAITTTVVSLVVIGLSVSLWLMHRALLAEKISLSNSEKLQAEQLLSRAGKLFRDANAMGGSHFFPLDETPERRYEPGEKEGITADFSGEAGCRKALALLRKQNDNPTPSLAYAIDLLAGFLDLHDRTNSLREIDSLLTESLAIKRSLYGPDHREVVDAMERLANFDKPGRTLTERITMLEETLALRKKLSERFPDDTRQTINTLITLRRQFGRRLARFDLRALRQSGGDVICFVDVNAQFV